MSQPEKKKELRLKIVRAIWHVLEEPTFSVSTEARVGAIADAVLAILDAEAAA